MLSPDLRRKLSRLNRERGDAESPPQHPAPQAVTLEAVLAGHVHACESGELYVCERAARDLHPGAREALVGGLEALQGLGAAPEEALFLDIETCGLANCPLFLVGVMSVREGDLKIEQFFARDYSEEKSVLVHAAGLIAGYRMLVTFNGKSFDIPYMLDRMTFHRLGARFDQEHLDLLHCARRRWSRELPDCRLRTLEESICGRRRYGDPPGEIIPDLYHAFVRTGNAAPLEGVLRHNALDLITMAELIPHLVLQPG